MSDREFLNQVRSTYDTVAGGYSEIFADEMSREPVLRNQLTLFADAASGPAADVGCGPGHVTAFLHGKGLEVYGVDLSPGMVQQARATYPDLRFEVGTMTALDIADRSLGGLNAWYSTIHIPDDLLPGVFAEFHRVLRPGAPLMLAFQIGDSPRHYAKGWGHDIDLIIHRRRPETVAAMLRELGFQVVSTTVYEPLTPIEPGWQAAFLLAHKLSSPTSSAENS